jgi:DNA replication protein DnaC
MGQMVCEKCGGSGWRIVERDGISGAERCDCGPAEGPPDFESAANIPLLYRNASFDNFVLPNDNPIAHEQMGRVLLKVRSYVREFPFGPKPGLMLMGDIGTGKTHLAVAALRALMQKGIEGLFLDYSNLLERIRAGWNPDAGAGERNTYQSCLEIPLLLLDDVGSQRSIEWVQDTMTAIVTQRCNDRKALIITTNLPDPDLGGVMVQRTPGVQKVEYRLTLADKIGERARSRLFEMCELIRMPMTSDYRVTRSK